MWVNLHKSSSDIFLYITYSVSVREDKKVMSSKFITKGPIVVLGGAWAGGAEFWSVSPPLLFPT